MVLSEEGRSAVYSRPSFFGEDHAALVSYSNSSIAFLGHHRRWCRRNAMLRQFLHALLELHETVRGGGTSRSGRQTVPRRRGKSVGRLEIFRPSGEVGFYQRFGVFKIRGVRQEFLHRRGGRRRPTPLVVQHPLRMAEIVVKPPMEFLRRDIGVEGNGPIHLRV